MEDLINAIVFSKNLNQKFVTYLPVGEKHPNQT